MVEVTEGEIRPNQDEIEVINLGIEQEVKEVKTSAKLTKEDRKRLVSLFTKYLDIVA